MDAALAPALADAKAYLRIADTGEDALTTGLIGSALSLCEAFTGAVPIVRAVVETLPATGGWRRLTAAPVRAITGVVGIGADGADIMLPVGAYAIDLDGRGGGSVRTAWGPAVRVRVTAQVGIADDWAGLPAPIRQGVVRLVAHLFAHRDAQDEAGPPAVVAALWRPWRRMRLS